MGQLCDGSHGSWVSCVMGHMGHGSVVSWVTWVMGQLCHGSHGSWVTKYDQQFAAKSFFCFQNIVFMKLITDKRTVEQTNRWTVPSRTAPYQAAGV